MGLLGVSSIAGLDPSYLYRPAPVVTVPHVTSALDPLLDLPPERY
jgi:hypothetical protein